MKHILVTGAAGNLGQSVVRRLAERGVQVRAFDLPSAAHARRLEALGPRVEWAPGDVTSVADLERAVRGVDGIAHLAGLLPPVSERKPAVAMAVNAQGTRQLIAAAQRLAPEAPFVFASSFSVYGPGQAARGLATGDSPTEATDTYTASKLEAEAALRASTLPWTILRVAAAIEGSASVQDPIVLRLMFEYAAEQPMELVHGDDVATAFVNALFEPRARRRVLPIGGGPSCRLTQRELMKLTFGALGVRDLPEAAHGRAPNYTCYLDTSEAQALLDFQRHSLDDIKRDLLANLGWRAPLARAFSPLVRRLLLHFSGPYRGAPAHPTWRAMMDAGY